MDVDGRPLSNRSRIMSKSAVVSSRFGLKTKVGIREGSDEEEEDSHDEDEKNPKPKSKSSTPAPPEEGLQWTPATALLNPYKPSDAPLSPSNNTTTQSTRPASTGAYIKHRQMEDMSPEELRAALASALKEVDRAQSEAALLREVIRREPAGAPMLRKRVSFSNEVDLEAIGQTNRDTFRSSDSTSRSLLNETLHTSIRDRPVSDRPVCVTNQEGVSDRVATVSDRDNQDADNVQKKLITSRHDKLVQQNIYIALSATLRILFAEIGYRHEMEQLSETIKSLRTEFPLYPQKYTLFEDRKTRFAYIFLFCKINSVLIASALNNVPAPHCELLYNCSNVACVGGGSGEAVFGVAQYLKKFHGIRSVSLSSLKIRVFDPEESWRLTWERVYLENFLTCTTFDPVSKFINLSPESVTDLKLSTIDLFTFAFVRRPLFNNSWAITWVILDKFVECSKSGAFMLVIGMDGDVIARDIDNWLKVRPDMLTVYEYVGSVWDMDPLSTELIIHGYQKYVEQFGNLEDSVSSSKIRIRVSRKISASIRSRRMSGALRMLNESDSESDGDK